AVAKNILRSASREQSLADRLGMIRDRLAAMEDAASIAFFEVTAFDRLLKTTISLCPTCLAHVPAIVYTLDGRVLMTKRCDEHGLSQALIESDAAFYHLSNKDRWGRRFVDDRVMKFPSFQGGCCANGGCGSAEGNASVAPTDFTDQMANKTCTILVEVTNA